MPTNEIAPAQTQTETTTRNAATQTDAQTRAIAMQTMVTTTQIQTDVTTAADTCVFPRQASRNATKAYETRERATQTHERMRMDAQMQRDNPRSCTMTCETAGQTKDAAMWTCKTRERQTREKEVWERERCERERRKHDMAVQTELPGAHPPPISA
jgi:hypothetical protein